MHHGVVHVAEIKWGIVRQASTALDILTLGNFQEVIGIVDRFVTRANPKMPLPAGPKPLSVRVSGSRN